MTAAVIPLRPVPTFEQVVRMPDPVIFKPDRTLYVSPPDPNLFEHHEDKLGQQNTQNENALLHQLQIKQAAQTNNCLLYTSPSPRDRTRSRMPSSA